MFQKLLLSLAGPQIAVYSSSLRLYVCDGRLSEYTRCTYRTSGIFQSQLLSNVFQLLPKRIYNEALADEAVVEHANAFKHLGSRGDKEKEEGMSNTRGGLLM
ncbi:unnamed protein product [Cylicostephanus goldi]|uniref:Uncharacterized protein n=1 Tax=Cylicostephanus goldi TaxID=71465 RepID=A0A3P6RKZ5_CYLGO|nr:unnamed protein product [Cylicostephanus goldi]